MSDSDREEALYAEASKELDGTSRKEGLWAKCYATCEGDENKAKALYLKTRVEQLESQEVEKDEPPTSLQSDDAPLSGNSPLPQKSDQNQDGESETKDDVEPFGKVWTRENLKIFGGYFVAAQVFMFLHFLAYKSDVIGVSYSSPNHYTSTDHWLGNYVKWIGHLEYTDTFLPALGGLIGLGIGHTAIPLLVALAAKWIIPPCGELSKKRFMLIMNWAFGFMVIFWILTMP